MSCEQPGVAANMQFNFLGTPPGEYIYNILSSETTKLSSNLIFHNIHGLYTVYQKIGTLWFHYELYDRINFKNMLIF